jgi:hypothetical protein
MRKMTNIPETFYNQISNYTLKNGCKIKVWQSGRMKYGMSVKHSSGSCDIYGFVCGKKDLEKNIKFHLADYIHNDVLESEAEKCESKARSYTAMVEKRKEEIISLLGIEEGNKYIMLADKMGVSII